MADEQEQSQQAAPVVVVVEGGGECRQYPPVVLRPQGERRWRSVLVAVAAVKLSSPLRSRAIDPGAIYTGTGWVGMEAAVELYSRTAAVLAQLDRDERQVLELYACGASLRAIDEGMRRRKGTAKRLLAAATSRARAALLAQGILEERS